MRLELKYRVSKLCISYTLCSRRFMPRTFSHHFNEKSDPCSSHTLGLHKITPPEHSQTQFRENCGERNDRKKFTSLRQGSLLWLSEGYQGSLRILPYVYLYLSVLWFSFTCSVVNWVWIFSKYVSLFRLLTRPHLVFSRIVITHIDFENPQVLVNRTRWWVLKTTRG